MARRQQRRIQHTRGQWPLLLDAGRICLGLAYGMVRTVHERSLTKHCPPVDGIGSAHGCSYHCVI